MTKPSRSYAGIAAGELHAMQGYKSTTEPAQQYSAVVVVVVRVLQHHTDAQLLNFYLVGRAAYSMHLQPVVRNLHCESLSHQTWPKGSDPGALHIIPESHNARCYTHQSLTTHQRPTQTLHAMQR